MKKFIVILAICLGCWQAHSQQYIDAIILKNQTDTVFGKIVSISDSSLVIDRFNVIFDIAKDNIVSYIQNYRPLTPQEQNATTETESMINKNFFILSNF